MAASLTRILLAGGFLCVVFPAFALELLPDPTRPPAEILSAGKEKARDPAQPAMPDGLQSIIISPQHRAAVINGETVELGGKVGEATLVEVRENSVVLQGALGKRVLELFPGVHLNNGALSASRKDNSAVQKNKGTPKVSNANAAESTGTEQNKDEK